MKRRTFATYQEGKEKVFWNLHSQKGNAISFYSVKCSIDKWIYYARENGFVLYIQRFLFPKVHFVSVERWHFGMPRTHFNFKKKHFNNDRERRQSHRGGHARRRRSKMRCFFASLKCAFLGIAAFLRAPHFATSQCFSLRSFWMPSFTAFCYFEIYFYVFFLN